MENHTRFDLNQHYERWRASLRAAEGFRAEDAAELESHLRDAMEDLQAKGLSEEEAFLVATRRLGDVAELDREFCQAKPATLWARRAFWMIAGVLLFDLIMGMSELVSRVVLLLGASLPVSGLGLGWIGLGARLAALGGFALLAGWLLVRVAPEGSGPLARCFRWPLASLVVLLLAGGGLHAANLAAQTWLVRLMVPSKLGQVFAITMWGRGVLAILVGALLVMAFVRLASSRFAKAHAHLGAVVAALLMVLALGVGCGKAKQTSSPDQPRAASSSQTPTEKCIALWAAGQQDGALEAFLKLDLSQSQLFSGGNVLSYSETQFASLLPAAREKLAPQMMADLSAIKALCRRVSEAGKEAQAKGDAAKAGLCRQQLQKLGDKLDRPSSLLLLQMVGQAVKKLAR